MKPSEKISKLSDEKGIVEQSTIVRDKQLIVDEDNTYVTFKASDLQALAAELDAQHDSLKAELEKQQRLNEHFACETCGGIGVVGSPPNDYYDCPACIEKDREHNSLVIIEAANEFPIILRKMWSGGEVKDWLIEYAADTIKPKEEA